MWRNYLTVGIRALTRNRVHAVINIVGLALGLAACVMILLYVRYELSYDKWLADSDRIYQVQATWHELERPVSPNQTSPFPVRDTLAGGFPQIEALSVFRPDEYAVMKDGRANATEIALVDPAFFDIFKLGFARGSAATALPDTDSIVLTETEALRQFGTTDVIGRTVTIASDGERDDNRVTGILRDLPENSHLALSAIMRFDPSAWDEVPAAYKGWGSMSQYHYVKLRPGARAADVNAALPAWEKRVIAPQDIGGRMSSQADIMDMKLVPVAEVHFGVAQKGAMTPGNDMRTIVTFAIVAGLILVMACINFINLATARASQRAREVALRKLLGARRRQLVAQFIGESLMLATLAMVIALTVVEIALPRLSSFLEADLSIAYFGTDGVLPYLAALVLFVGTVGGLYPALYLSRFQPGKVLKANQSASDAPGSGKLRNVLVVAQFAVSIGLIICTAIVYSQTRYVQSADPGYEREGIVQLSGADAESVAQNAETMKRVIAAVPGVVGVAHTNVGVATPGSSLLAVEAPGLTEPLSIAFTRVEPEFFETMGMRLVAGRLLSDDFARDRMLEAGDSVNAGAWIARGLNVVVSEATVKRLGLGDPRSAIGRQVRIWLAEPDAMIPSTIVGVVADTRFRSARDAVEPLIFSYDPDSFTHFVVRYRSDDPAAVMAGIEQAWQRIVPDVPFDGRFSEDLVAELYEADTARGTVFASFALFAIVIACLGLFGLAAFTAERRTKEIGLRKVFGARVQDIVRLLAWQFSKPVILANIIAWPVAWWVMRDWLNGFDSRIALGPGPFVLAGLLTLAIAIGTIAGHALKVARANPIHALRYE